MILFWSLIAVLLAIAIGFMVYPVINHQAGWKTGSAQLVIVVTVMIPMIAFGLYLYWGQSQSVAKWYAQQQQAANLRKELGSPEQVILRLQQHLKEEPSSVQGWYLLGKLYFSQQRFDKAATAYAQLKQLQPNNPDFSVQYAQAQYFANRHKMSPEIYRLLQQVLRRDAGNVLAINLLAIDAYRKANYQTAIDYWQRLLNQYPPNSNDYQAIATAIDNAQLALQRQLPSKLAFQVEVRLADSLKAKVSGEETVFVYARAATGSAMPLAITRVKAHSLPIKLTLSEAMTMNPSRTLADANKINIVARLSRSGHAMPNKGDLIGKSQVLSITKHKTTAVLIIIDQVIDG